MNKNPPLIILESPYAGDIQLNFRYWKAANLYSIFSCGEAPISSHFYYTEFLNDKKEEERDLGISLGYTLWARADKIIFYADLGLSPGMKLALKKARRDDRSHEIRYIGNSWERWVSDLTRATRA